MILMCVYAVSADYIPAQFIGRRALLGKHFLTVSRFGFLRAFQCLLQKLGGIAVSTSTKACCSLRKAPFLAQRTLISQHPFRRTFPQQDWMTGLSPV